jgi:hypothetical protein
MGGSGVVLPGLTQQRFSLCADSSPVEFRKPLLLALHTSICSTAQVQLKGHARRLSKPNIRSLKQEPERTFL